MNAIDVIPPITDELGRFWDQPGRWEIEMDDTHALMGPETFRGLREYSATLPSGVYAGKMWRTRRGSRWYLFWFGHANNPAKVNVNHREILLVGGSTQ